MSSTLLRRFGGCVCVCVRVRVRVCMYACVRSCVCQILPLFSSLWAAVTLCMRPASFRFESCYNISMFDGNYFNYP